MSNDSTVTMRRLGKVVKKGAKDFARFLLGKADASTRCNFEH